MNYRHNRFSLTNVQLDGTSHSVYLTAGTGDGWRGTSWGVGTGAGDACSGYTYNQTTIPDGCVNLDNYYAAGRINCLFHWPNSIL